MCDCDALEYEDFESILTSLSRKAPAPQVEEPAPVPVPLISAKRKK